MKRWIKRSLIAVFGLSIIGAGLAACGHRHPGSGFTQASAEDVAKWRGRIVERAAKELELNEAQKQRLGVLFDKMNEQRTAFVGSTTDPRASLRTLVQGEKFDRTQASALITEKTEAVRGKSPEVINAMAEFFDSLNPSQQAKVREFMDKRGFRSGGGWRG
jgi:periplasmic protein CpxP/Spy